MEVARLANQDAIALRWRGGGKYAHVLGLPTHTDTQNCPLSSLVWGSLCLPELFCALPIVYQFISVHGLGGYEEGDLTIHTGGGSAAAI